MDTNRVIAYVRCSTIEQAKDGMSLEAQETRIRAWADAVGAEVVELVVDAGVSGGRPLADRPGGARILEVMAARRPDVDAIVCLRLDRLGRDAAETLNLLKRFRTSKVGLVAIADRIDLSAAMGRAMAQLQAVIAELEKGLIAERTRDALGEIRRQGRAWNHDPFGWSTVGGHLEPNQTEQDALHLAADLREQGKSFQAVADALTEAGFATKRGGPWYAASVRAVLLTAEKMAA